MDSTTLFKDKSIKPHEIRYFIHGTTLAVNTIIQRAGARTALLVTAGFRDVLKIARLRIPDLFNFMTEVPAPLVPRSLVFEIPERCSATGKIVQPLDESSRARGSDGGTRQGCRTLLRSASCTAIATRTTRIAHARLLNRQRQSSTPQFRLTFWPQMREYERALVAVMNAYVGKKMRSYFTGLQKGVRSLGVEARIFSTKSNGGIMNVGEAGERPVETLLSGPAAGVIGATFGRHAPQVFERVITFDMGGTSADVAVVEGEPRHSTESMVGDFPVIMPAIDVTSIGAGGGSIAWTDPSRRAEGRTAQSAERAPGPACYGLGGKEATVTDAYVASASSIRSNSSVAQFRSIRPWREKAVERIGQVLGLGARETAESILQRRNLARCMRLWCRSWLARALTTKTSPYSTSAARDRRMGSCWRARSVSGALSCRCTQVYCALQDHCQPTLRATSSAPSTNLSESSRQTTSLANCASGWSSWRRKAMRG